MIAEGFNYWVHAALMMIGLYAIIAKPHFVKKLIGLGLLQTGVFLFFITLADVRGGTAPIVEPGGATVFVNPLPHVLILTAIVVSVSTTAVGLALCIRIREEWGTCEDDELRAREQR